MKKVFAIISLMLVLVSIPFVFASEPEGIMPDSFMYVLDRAAESLSLTLTFSPEKRVLKRLEIAQERLLEAQYLIDIEDFETLAEVRSHYTESLAAMQTDFISLAEEKTDSLRTKYLTHASAAESFVRKAQDAMGDNEYVAELTEFTRSLEKLHSAAPATFGVSCDKGTYIDDGSYSGCAECTSSSECSEGWTCEKYQCIPPPSKDECKGTYLDNENFTGCAECVEDSECSGSKICTNYVCVNPPEKKFDNSNMVYLEMHARPENSDGPGARIAFENKEDKNVENSIYLAAVDEADRSPPITKVQFDVETDEGIEELLLELDKKKAVNFGDSEIVFTLIEVDLTHDAAILGVYDVTGDPMKIRLYQDSGDNGYYSKIFAPTPEDKEVRNFLSMNAISDTDNKDVVGFEIQAQEGSDYAILAEGDKQTLDWGDTSWELEVLSINEKQGYSVVAISQP